MNWTQVKIYTTTEGIEPLTGSLLDFWESADLSSRTHRTLMNFCTIPPRTGITSTRML